MDKLFESIDKLLRTCVEFFGVNFTIFLIIAIPLILFAYKIYTDWAKRNEVNATITAKDETIQVLAEQNRQLRVIQLKHLGWTDEAIETVVMKNTPKDAIEAREMLQNSKLKKLDKSSKDKVEGEKNDYFITNFLNHFSILYLPISRNHLEYARNPPLARYSLPQSNTRFIRACPI